MCVISPYSNGAVQIRVGLELAELTLTITVEKLTVCGKISCKISPGKLLGVSETLP